MNQGLVAAAMPRHRVLLALSALCTLAFLGWVLWFCRFGVDFRDEGFYFVWMSDPFKYDVSITQFGFVYHPLFELVGRDIVAIRRLNLLITFGLAWLLAGMVIRQSAGLAIAPGTRWVLAAALSCSSLSFLHTWVPTPSYNWLALQSLMFATIGLLLVSGAQKQGGWGGWILVGVAGWLTFMAKPTSAALLAVTACLYVFLAGRVNWRAMLLGAGTAMLLLFASAIWIDGSVMRFVQRNQVGVDFASLIWGGRKLSRFVRLGELQLGAWLRLTLGIGIVLLAVLLLMAKGASKWPRRLAAWTGGVLLLAALAIMAGLAQGLVPPTEYHKGLLPVIMPLAALPTLALLYVRRQREAEGSRWAIVGLLLVLPYVYVFGTFNNYWWQMSQATFFWVLAGAVLVTRPPASASSSTPQSSSVVLPALVLSMASQFVIAAVVQTGIEAPYGQPVSLRDQHRKVRVGEPPSSLRLAPGFGDFFDQAIQISRAAGFIPGTPMLDLTGQSPTTLYAIAASSTSQPWIIGGYPGSDALAQAYLDRVSCAELARMWLLVRPAGPTGLSPALLNTYGADLDRDYEKVGTMAIDGRLFGYLESWSQHLLRPRRAPDVAQEACMRARSGTP